MNKGDLATLLGISTRHVDRLEQEHGLKRWQDGSEHDLEFCVRSYGAYLRRDEETRQARRGLLVSQTVDRRLKTRATLGRMVTDEELQEFVSQTWITFLTAWRVISAHLYYRLRGILPDDDAARTAACGLENEAVGWLREARVQAEDKLKEVLRVRRRREARYRVAGEA